MSSALHEAWVLWEVGIGAAVATGSLVGLGQGIGTPLLWESEDTSSFIHLNACLLTHRLVPSQCFGNLPVGLRLRAQHMDGSASLSQPRQALPLPRKSLPAAGLVCHSAIFQLTLPSCEGCQKAVSQIAASLDKASCWLLGPPLQLPSVLPVWGLPPSQHSVPLSERVNGSKLRAAIGGLRVPRLPWLGKGNANSANTALLSRVLSSEPGSVC